MATAPPTITALPAPPDPNDRSTFNARAYPWSVAQQTLAVEVNAVAANVYANAQEAKTQAEAATTNGAAQVALATAQAEAATTKAGEASTSAASAASSATAALAAKNAAATRAADAEASRIAASKLNLGNKAAPPTVDNQGAALLAGATYYDTTLNKWRVWTGAGWGDGISAIAGVSSINGMTGNVTLPPTQTVAYDNRANLRSQSPVNGEMAVIDGLGLFVFATGSDEPDDDESCFATASGKWLLQCTDWDLLSSWQLPDDEARGGSILLGTATCAITSVAYLASASFTGTVTGASVGDLVIATPPAELGATSADTGCLSYYAWISAANTVTVMLTNASASTVTTSTAIRTAWPIAVIKGAQP